MKHQESVRRDLLGAQNRIIIPAGSFPIDRVSTCSYNMTMPKSKTPPNLHFPLREAKNRLSELVRRAAQGEQIIITLHGEPRVQLSRVLQKSRPFKVDRKGPQEVRVAGAQ